MRKNSIKNTRVNEAVRQELSTLISLEVKDPRVDMMTTVTRAVVATDLKTCKVYISVLEDEKREPLMAALKNAKGYIRRELGKKMIIRHSPELIFVSDKNIEYGVHIAKVLAETGISAQSEEEES